MAQYGPEVQESIYYPIEPYIKVYDLAMIGLLGFYSLFDYTP
jgi:hypothetical protein